MSKILLVLIALVSVASVCFSREASAQSDVSNTTAPVKTSTITGTITSLDSVGNTLVVRTDSGDVTFSVADDAVITKGSEQVGLQDIETADPVTVDYKTASGGGNVAVKIVDNNAANQW